MANQPTTTPGSSPSSLTPVQAKVLALMLDGVHHTTIAKRLSGGDRRKAYKWRQRIRGWVQTNPTFSNSLAMGIRATTAVEMPEINEAMIRRAKKGRIDAVKLAMATTGYHSDRIDHKHSGEVQISVSIPRPPAGHGQIEEPIVDADVVEE